MFFFVAGTPQLAHHNPYNHNCICYTVLVSPPESIGLPGGNSESFICFATTPTSDPVTDIQWYLNDTLLHDNVLGSTRTLTNLTGSGTGGLKFLNLSEALNTTTIKCRIEFASGVVHVSPTSLLLIQGSRPQRAIYCIVHSWNTHHYSLITTIQRLSIKINLSWSVEALVGFPSCHK